MDVFFMSFKESNAESNWLRVKELHPNALRLHGIVGIDRIHLLCNQLATTDYFWTVDGDNWLTEPLQYNTSDIIADLTLFKAIDPLNDSTTALGGIKLWKKDSFINKDMSRGDFTLNATNSKQVVDKVFCITKYTDSPYDAWKTAFRHCVKLMSVLFRNRPNAKNIDFYIEQWRKCESIDKPNANWAYQGYLDARNYVDQYDNQLDELRKINNYDWLEEHFRKLHEN
jgi:hypothetical protein